MNFLYLLILLLTALCSNVHADQVTVPLADPSQKSTQESVQEQLADQSDKTDKSAEPALAQDQMYDIRGPILIPDSNRILWWIAAVLLAILLLALFFFFWKRRSRKQKAILAHETALRELDRAGPLIEEQNINAFITLIDQTLRRYIEQRFNIFARRQTTREFIHGLAEDREDVPAPLTENSENLKTWLQHCDLVKFAKHEPTVAESETTVSICREFIEKTKEEKVSRGQGFEVSMEKI